MSSDIRPDPAAGTSHRRLRHVLETWIPDQVRDDRFRTSRWTSCGD